MTKHLRSPLFANQVVVLKDATVRFKFRASLEWDDEMFVTQANKLGKIASARNG